MKRSGSTNAIPSSVTLGNSGEYKKMKSLDLLAPSIILIALIGFPATAHHSSTYFDMEAEVVHENVTVVDFQVANPHGLLVYLVTDDEGNEVEWNAELPSANFSRRGGVTESVLNAGDKLTVVIGAPGLPTRTRERLMRLTRAEFPNGDVATFTGRSATFTRAGTE